MAPNSKLRPREPSPGRLLVIMKSGERQKLVRAIQELSREFGKADYEGPAMTEGRGIGVRSLGFSRPIGRDELVDIKRRCLQLEEKSGSGEEGLVLDPLLVTPFSVVRTDTIEMPWRIYLYKGIWAEIIYQFEGHVFRARNTSDPLFLDRRIVTACNDVRMILTTGGGR